MPRDPDTMAICGPDKVECVESALQTVEETAFRDDGSGTNCQCLPSCTDLDFPHETSSSSVRKAKLVDLPDKLKGKRASF